ncbi:polysaccharide pyruvyl transferase family protein [Termitidicoccus mucosus]
MMNRRDFLTRAALAAGAAALPLRALAEKCCSTAKPGRAPCILLRGSWQSVNIGDIGHTPGAIQMIQRWLPEARFILWAGGTEHGAKEMLQRSFPDLRIVSPVRGSDGRLRHASTMLDKDGNPVAPGLAEAWEEADIMIHGSGSGFAARAQLAAFHRATGKPYGVLGTSIDPISGFGGDCDPEGGTLADLQTRIEKLPRTHLDKQTRDIIDRAAFMFTRETMSRDYLRFQGARTPILEFGPDTQFGMTLRDDARGDAYRESNNLPDGQFLCVIPRLRYTPYYEIYNRPRNETDRHRDAISDRSVESDHAKLREVITRYVRATDNRVMTCPEMTYQAPLAKRAVIDLLPDDVKKNVVWRSDYWLPDEAAAIYAKAQAVVSYDCHSPIIAITHGTPAFYVRQPTDTCKGEMYRDIGVADWLFEIDETTGGEIWSRLETVLREPAKSRAYAAAAMSRVHKAQRRMVAALEETIA